MIYYLKGKIVDKKEDFVVVDVNGVGYKVLTAPETRDVLGERDTLFCFVQKTEKDDRIYGFKKKENLELFEKLTKISGVGPKTAFHIASCFSIEELQKGIEKEDKKVMEKIFGIGKKKGQQVVFELSRKFIQEKKRPRKKESGPGKKDEALETLKNLGFSDTEARRALEKTAQGKKEEERVAEALKILGK